jgi:hypothetical protein
MNFLYSVLILLIFISFSVEGASSCSEDTNTREKAVSSVHQLLEARCNFYRNALEYLKNQDIPLREKTFFLSEYTGAPVPIVLEHPTKCLNLALPATEQDLTSFTKLSSISEDPRFLTILHYDLCCAKREMLKDFENRDADRRRFSKNSRKRSSQEVPQVIPSNGFSREFNDGIILNEALEYLHPHLTEGARTLESLLCSRKQIPAAHSSLQAEKISFFINQEMQALIERINSKFITLSGSVSQDILNNLERRSRAFAEITSGMGLDLVLRNSLSPLYNLEKVLDTFIQRHLPPVLPLPVQETTLPEEEEVSPAPQPLPEAAVLEEADVSSASIEVPAQATTPQPLPEAAVLEEADVSASTEVPDQATTEEEVVVDPKYRRQWTKEEKGIPQLPAATASVPQEDPNDILTATIRTLMGQQQLHFFREVIPKIFNPILKKDLEIGINAHNIKLFIPFKNNPERRILIYFHIPHKDNVEASPGAFWRCYLRTALTQTGWL